MSLAAVLVLGCSGFGDGLRSPRAVSAAIAERVARGSGAEVRLAELTPFGWRRVYVFGPYTPVATIRDSLRLHDSGEAARLARSIEARDDIDLLVFRFEHVGPQSMEHPRWQGDFGPELVGRGYRPDEAIFVVREPPRGSWGTLGPRPPAGGLTTR
jgi:hypothetical protein